MTALALALAYAGFAGLCLSMPRHGRQVWSRDAGLIAQVGLRFSGWLCLALSLAACVAAWGGIIGSVAWFGVLTAAGLVLVFLLPYAPRVTVALALAMPLVTGLSVLVG